MQGVGEGFVSNLGQRLVVARHACRKAYRFFAFLNGKFDNSNSSNFNTSVVLIYLKNQAQRHKKYNNLGYS